MRDEKPRVRLQVATESDVPDMVSIFSAAMRGDAHTALKVASQPPGIQDRGMAEGLRFWLAKPEKCLVLIATMGSGISGWACWSWRKISPPEIPKSSWLSDSSHLSSCPKNGSGQYIVPEPLEVAIRPPKSVDSRAGLDILEEITNANMSQWEDVKFSPPSGTGYMVLVAIAVHPDYQACGIGSALISWGVQHADNESVFSWVSSSDGGWSAFEKMGFELCGGLKANLDMFADGIKKQDNDGGSWGEYVWRFGKRLPV